MVACLFSLPPSIHPNPSIALLRYYNKEASDHFLNAWRCTNINLWVALSVRLGSACMREWVISLNVNNYQQWWQYVGSNDCIWLLSVGLDLSTISSSLFQQSLMSGNVKVHRILSMMVRISVFLQWFFCHDLSWKSPTPLSILGPLHMRNQWP